MTSYFNNIALCIVRTYVEILVIYMRNELIVVAIVNVLILNT